MIEYYQRSCRQNSDGSFFYEVKLQNNDNLNKQITGTYVPQERFWCTKGPNIRILLNVIKLSYQTVSTSISKIFGDFRLVIDKSTGFFNATKLCDQGGKKQFRQWKILEKSKKMIEYYQRSCRQNSDGSFFYEVKLQNNDNLNKQITGTYVPQERFWCTKGPNISLICN